MFLYLHRQVARLSLPVGPAGPGRSSVSASADGWVVFQIGGGWMNDLCRLPSVLAVTLEAETVIKSSETHASR